eukprot:jgi/Botrbrau1/23111/Bobra.0243s0045.1
MTFLSQGIKPCNSSGIFLQERLFNHHVVQSYRGVCCNRATLLYRSRRHSSCSHPYPRSTLLATRWLKSLRNSCKRRELQRRLRVRATGDDGGFSRQEGAHDDEPEVAILVLACAIGLATGAGVVLFNDGIHAIRHFVWAGTPLEATYWGRWARQLDMTTAWPLIVFPPTIGGLLVGTLRRVTGGLEDPPHVMPSTDNLTASSKAAPDRNRGNKIVDSVVTAVLQTYDEEFSSKGQSNGKPAGESEELAPIRPQKRSLGEHMELQGIALKKVFAPVLRALAAAVTLGTGASLGPEGPSVDIGRSVAKRLGTLLKSQQRRLTPLLAAGSGAGVAAGFNAPISGVFFAVETVLTKEQGKGSAAWNSSGLTVAMVLLASVLAAIVSQAGLGVAPAFRVPDYQLQSVYELPLVLLLGGLCGLLSASFSFSNKVARSGLGKLTDRGIPDYTLPALGGLVTGFTAIFYPEILYQGFGNVNAILAVRSRGVWAGPTAAAGGRQDFCHQPVPGGGPRGRHLRPLHLHGLAWMYSAPSIFKGKPVKSLCWGPLDPFVGVWSLMQTRVIFYAPSIFMGEPVRSMFGAHWIALLGWGVDVDLSVCERPVLEREVLKLCARQRKGEQRSLKNEGFVAGAAMGSAFGCLAEAACTPFGFDVTAPTAYALVGVAAMLAANCQVPLTAVLLLFELTHDYSIIVPTLGAVGVAYWVASIVPLESVSVQAALPFARDIPNSEEPSQSLRWRLFGYPAAVLPASGPAVGTAFPPSDAVLATAIPPASGVQLLQRVPHEDAATSPALPVLAAVAAIPAAAAGTGSVPPGGSGAVLLEHEMENGATVSESRAIVVGGDLLPPLASGSTNDGTSISSNGASAAAGAGVKLWVASDTSEGATEGLMGTGNGAELEQYGGTANGTAEEVAEGAGGGGGLLAALLSGLTVGRATKRDWVVVQPEALLPDVLQLMEGSEVRFAVVQAQDSGVVCGVLTREAVAETLASAREEAVAGVVDPCALEQSVGACFIPDGWLDQPVEAQPRQ